jgi:peptidoglycan/xylan/chitin deacetylase (PgdA/CDA1 family)
MFVPTGSWNARPRWVTNASNALFRERVLSRDEIRRLSSEPLVTVGSHSVSHPDLRRLEDAVVDRELVDSRQELETLVGRSVTSFSFPFGAYDERVVSRALAAGYQRLFISTPDRADVGRASATIGRTSVEPDDWPIEYRLKVAGAYRWRCRWRAGER